TWVARNRSAFRPGRPAADNGPSRPPPAIWLGYALSAALLATGAIGAYAMRPPSAETGSAPG
ncbi:MAG TPA: hypothetical protein VM055_00955, partial [Novosphingobium sp.]|nr:hypothetical protein [Novosphingobium sp.]